MRQTEHKTKIKQILCTISKFAEYLKTVDTFLKNNISILKQTLLKFQ